ncbi:MAG: hypothetical protein D6729_09995, partial [Deltaproteobacteria bacterium]
GDSTRVVSLSDLQAMAGGAAAPSAPEAPATQASAQPGGDPFAAAMMDEAPGEGDFNPDATVVAKVPDALLQATARQPGGGPARDPDEAHFQEVFQAFLKTRQECGEPTAGLTFEKFAEKLRKNRDAIKAKHGARTVRFQVYVKAGKAALKATPIK